MRKVLSWLHFLGCVGFTIFSIFFIYYYISDMYDEECLAIIAICLTALITTGTGIYFFIVGATRELTQLEKLKFDNKILKAKLEKSRLEDELSQRKSMNK